MNLLSAFEEYLRRAIGAQPPQQRGRGLLAMYLSGLQGFLARRVDPVPRTVCRSAALDSNPLATDHQSRLAELEEMLRSGDAAVNDPANGFLSARAESFLNRAENPNEALFVDNLRGEWGIHHFHMCQPRHDDLLFAILTDTHAYLIDIGSHRRGQTNLYSQHLLSVAYGEWPHLFSPLQGVSGSSLSPEQVRNLRRNNVGHVPPLAPAAAMPPMMLYSVAGISLQMQQLADAITMELSSVEDQLRSVAVEQVAAEIGCATSDLELAQDQDFDGAIYLTHSTTGQVFRMRAEFGDHLNVALELVRTATR